MSELALDGAPAVESDAPEGVEPAAEAPAWSGPDQESWEQVQEGIGYLLSLQEAQRQVYGGGQQQQEPQQAAFDPFSDDPTGQLREIIRAEMEPYQQTYEQIALSEANERAMDILNDVVARDGEFLLPDSLAKARALADTYVGQEAQKYGYLPDGRGGYVPHPRAAEAALERAANDVREYEQAIGKAYHDRQINHLQTLSGAPREPGSGATGAQQVVTQTGGDEMDLVKKYFQPR